MVGRVFRTGTECGRCQGGKYKINVIRDCWMTVLGELHERAISRDQMNEMKSGRASSANHRYQT